MLLRFIRIYGVGKTLYKVQGRMRPRVVLPRPRRARTRDIGVIGCGQFAFSTIGFHLVRNLGNRFVDCFDVSEDAASSFADFYRIERPAGDAGALIDNPQVRVVYVASNHASHAQYAADALRAGKTVYVEKPVAVELSQLVALQEAAEESAAPIFAGYNRPFSAAIRELRPWVDPDRPLSLSCVVHGHHLDADHWYRDPREGTRICGNMGHWLDLAVHLLSWGMVPKRWRIHVAWSDDSVRDENLTVSLVSSRGDLVSITMTSRTEPFEGIYESIDLQWGDVIGRIDDFREMTLRRGSERMHRRYRPKDVGHDTALMQPFGESSRDWSEVILSTHLMLAIKDMVEGSDRVRDFDFGASGVPLVS